MTKLSEVKKHPLKFNELISLSCIAYFNDERKPDCWVAIEEDSTFEIKEAAFMSPEKYDDIIQGLKALAYVLEQKRDGIR